MPHIVYILLLFSLLHSVWRYRSANQKSMRSSRTLLINSVQINWSTERTTEVLKDSPLFHFCIKMKSYCSALPQSSNNLLFTSSHLDPCTTFAIVPGHALMKLDMTVIEAFFSCSILIHSWLRFTDSEEVILYKQIAIQTLHLQSFFTNTSFLNNDDC